MSTDAPESMKRIISSLAERGAVLGWQPTAEENMFIISFTNHSVSIFRWRSSRGSDNYTIGVLNEEGRELESYRVISGEGDDLYDATDQLFKDARRVALKVDEGLDAVLKEIEAV